MRSRDTSGPGWQRSAHPIPFDCHGQHGNAASARSHLVKIREIPSFLEQGDDLHRCIHVTRDPELATHVGLNPIQFTMVDPDQIG